MIPASKYRVGDFVEYKYSGSFLTQPLFLNEEVIEKLGNQLTILVHLKISTKERRWKQFVTDTPENKKSNHVDRLVQISSSGREIDLPNQNNEDLLSLYQGTYFIPDGPPTNLAVGRTSVFVCGSKVDAKKTHGQQKIGGKEYFFETYESEDFPWTHIGAEYALGGTTFYKVEVTRCRR